MAYKLIEIEGIGPQYAARLQERLGIKTVEELLELGATAKGRESVAAQADIEEKLILHWTNMADLFRIKGIGEEFSHLLEAAGVDTVKELRNRVPANLHAKMTEINESKKLTRRLPTLDETTSWVNQAKELDPVMTY